MAIRVSCQCGKQILVPDKYAGRMGTCKACGAVVHIPPAGTHARKPPAIPKIDGRAAPSNLQHDVGAPVPRASSSGSTDKSKAALMACPDCGAAVSRLAPNCPACGRPFKKARRGCLRSCLLFVGLPFVALILLAMIGSLLDPDGGNSRPSGMIPEVSKFLESHPEFGRPIHARRAQNWVKGKRQRIEFMSGRILEFYELNGQVMTVWESSPDRERVIVWGESYKPEPFVPVDRPALSDLPAYKILYVVEPMKGGKTGDVLMPSLSRSTPTVERESIARRITALEGWVEIRLYSTEEAYEANYSASFAEQHPNAMRTGFLGVISDGQFIPGEIFYP